MSLKLKNLDREPTAEAMEPMDLPEHLTVELTDMATEQSERWDRPYAGPPEPADIPLQFDMYVHGKDGSEKYVWSLGTPCEDSISLEAIMQCASAMDAVAYALKAVRIPKPHYIIKVMMSIRGVELAEVGPAVGHIALQAGRYAQKPHISRRPPKVVTPQLLVAIMRAHSETLAEEAAAAEGYKDLLELRALEAAAGVFEAYFDD